MHHTLYLQIIPPPPPAFLPLLLLLLLLYTLHFTLIYIIPKNTL